MTTQQTPQQTPLTPLQQRYLALGQAYTLAQVQFSSAVQGGDLNQARTLHQQLEQLSKRLRQQHERFCKAFSCITFLEKPSAFIVFIMTIAAALKEFRESVTHQYD